MPEEKKPVRMLEVEGWLNIEAKRRSNGADYIAFTGNITQKPSRGSNVIASLRVEARIPARALEVPVANIDIEIPEHAVRFEPDVSIEVGDETT